jgi:DNA-binding protein H-NS
MTSFVEIVTKKNRFRAACKDLTVSDMETMAKSLAEFIEKRVQQEAEAQAAQAAQVAKKQEILKAMSAAGLSIDDFFVKDDPMLQKNKKSVVAQYRVTDANGQMYEWSGRGRTPKAFTEYFANGGSKESCRI